MVKGILSSIIASVLFGGLYYFVTLLEPLSGQEVLGWRILVTFPFITLFIFVTKAQVYIRVLWRRLRKQPFLLLPILFNSAMMGFQFWLFMWAPRNGKALEVSLGYFLLPLALVFLGYFVYGEKLTKLKILAIICALSGVGLGIYRAGYFAWETGAVAFGYMAYFYVRRRFGLNHLGGLWFDMGLLVPISIWMIFYMGTGISAFADRPSLYGLILILGFLSSSSWIVYILANRWLPLTLFGMLSYVEPLLLIGVSFALGESISAEEWPMYSLIFVAVLLLVFEGVTYLGRKSRANLGK